MKLIQKNSHRVGLAMAFSLAGLCATMLANGQNSIGPACGPDIKEEILKAAEAAGVTKMSGAEQQKFESELYEKYKACAVPETVTKIAPSPEIAGCGKTAYVGSTWYEDMPCCGYDPQRRFFACPVTIKQNGGFGPPPLPGSREHVLNCVWNGSAWLPVAKDSVHLANNMFPASSPSWQFGVIAAANTNIHLVQPMSGQTRRARSILSWQLEPTSCDYKPIWGRVVDYQIRLDQ